MRYLLLVLSMLLFPLTTAHAEVRVGIGINVPGVSIGINLPAYPRLVPVPGYPVYYDPRINSNYFFYDGLYWVFYGDGWYVSSWYNGPWDWVDRAYVPLYVLRVPVRYYRRPPPYFHGWHPDAPPRWEDRWGPGWEQHRSDWDKKDARRAAPPPAPLPSYQRQYSGDRYPQKVERQHELQQQHYRYQPRDPMVQKHYEERGKGQGQGKGQDKGKGHND